MNLLLKSKIIIFVIRTLAIAWYLCNFFLLTLPAGSSIVKGERLLWKWTRSRELCLYLEIRYSFVYETDRGQRVCSRRRRLITAMLIIGEINSYLSYLKKILQLNIYISYFNNIIYFSSYYCTTLDALFESLLWTKYIYIYTVESIRYQIPLATRNLIYNITAIYFCSSRRFV